MTPAPKPNDVIVTLIVTMGIVIALAMIAQELFDDLHIFIISFISGINTFLNPIIDNVPQLIVIKLPIKREFANCRLD